jgi:hypothetical protein
VTGQVGFQPGIPWMRCPDEGEQCRNPGQVLKSSRVPWRPSRRHAARSEAPPQHPSLVRTRGPVDPATARRMTEALGPRETLNTYGTHSSRASSLPPDACILWERACSRQYVFRPSQGSTVTGQVGFQPGIPWMRNPDKGEQRRNPAWAFEELPDSSATKSASCCAKRSAAAASIARSHERACGSCDCAQDDEALGPRETLNTYGTHSSRASSLPQNQAMVGASLLATILVQTFPRFNGDWPGRVSTRHPVDAQPG